MSKVSGGAKKVLLVLGEHDAMVVRAGRNVAKLAINVASSLQVSHTYLKWHMHMCSQYTAGNRTWGHMVATQLQQSHMLDAEKSNSSMRSCVCTPGVHALGWAIVRALAVIHSFSGGSGSSCL